MPLSKSRPFASISSTTTCDSLVGFVFRIRLLTVVMIDGQARDATTVSMNASQVFNDVGFDLKRLDARRRVGNESLREMRRGLGCELVYRCLALDGIQRYPDVAGF